MKELERIIRTALAEDIGKGDITSELLIPADAEAILNFVAREPMIACGCFMAKMVYDIFGGDTQVTTVASEGSKLNAGNIIISATGSAKILLTGERVALNLMQRACGIATLTRKFVDAVQGTKAKILDTRKTMPGLRALDKYAVRVGGGQNHRMRLDDMVLIKDNHIALAGSIRDAVTKARAATTLPVVVECDTLAQLADAIAAKPDRVLLDNMTTEQLREAVAINGGQLPLEASGGVSLETVRAIAQTGVDYISIGKLTHAASAVDIGADITLT